MEVRKPLPGCYRDSQGRIVLELPDQLVSVLLELVAVAVDVDGLVAIGIAAGEEALVDTSREWLAAMRRNDTWIDEAFLRMAADLYLQRVYVDSMFS